MGIIFIIAALFLSTRVDFINGNMTHTALLPEYHYLMIAFIAALAFYYIYKLHNHDHILQGLVYACALCLFVGILIPYTDNLLYEHAHIFFASSESLDNTDLSVTEEKSSESMFFPPLITTSPL